MRALVVMACSSALAAGCGRVGFELRAGDGGDSTWWDTSWRYRKALVVDHTKVAGDLSDFPVLVIVTDPGLAAHAKSNGDDLVFVDAAGQELAYELESFAAGSLIAWVKIPALSASTDTTLTLYYGAATTTSHENRTAVWSNGFTGVYHFGDGTILDLRDATGVNDGVDNGATATSAAKIRGAVQFGGGPGGPNVQAAATGVDTTAGGHNTVSFWMSYTGAVGFAPFAFSTPVGYDLWLVTDSCFGFNTENGEVLGSAQPGLRNRWVYVVGVFYNGIPSAVQNQLYLDGVPQSLAICTGTATQARSAGGSIYWASYNGYELPGVLDEGRIANVTRSPAWIRTEYANQNDPASFLAVGPEQMP